MGTTENPPIRIHAANQEQADAVWRALCEQTAITEAEVWLAGRYLFHVVRRDGGMMTTLREAPQAHSPLPVSLEAS
jgi:uncharacterized protein YqjF (DUF2071 family)